MAGLVAREMHVALPCEATDMYRQHQLVWDAVCRVVQPSVRPIFIYTLLSPRLALVRSCNLGRGRVTRWSDRRLRATFVTSKIGLQDRKMHALGLAEAEEKVRAMLASHGILAEDVRIDQQRELIGTKVKESRRIVLPVSDVTIVARADNAAMASAAWVNGVGRGKRFGCGMMREA